MTEATKEHECISPKYIIMIKHILFNGWVIYGEDKTEEEVVKFFKGSNYAPHEVKIVEGKSVKMRALFEIDKEAIFQKHANGTVS